MIPSQTSNLMNSAQQQLHVTAGGGQQQQQNQFMNQQVSDLKLSIYETAGLN